MITTIDDIIRMDVGQQSDWKFGMCTRQVCRIDENQYSIDDTSLGWISAIVTLEQFEQLFDGKLSITELDWE